MIGIKNFPKGDDSTGRLLKKNRLENATINFSK
jgi:hypothetical protein